MYDTSSPWKVFSNRHYCEGIYLLNCRWHGCSTVTATMLQQSLARLLKSGWYDSSTVTGTIAQQSLAWLFDRHWHACSTVAGTIFQQSLARFFNSHWYNSSTVTGTILQQWLARFFNSHGQDFFLFSMLAEFFNSDVYCWIIVPCTRNTTHDPNFYL